MVSVDSPRPDDAVRVVWHPHDGPPQALTFERLDERTWSRREWRKVREEWQIVGVEHVGELAVENARAVAE